MILFIYEKCLCYNNWYFQWFWSTFWKLCIFAWDFAFAALRAIFQLKIGLEDEVGKGGTLLRKCCMAPLAPSSGGGTNLVAALAEFWTAYGITTLTHARCLISITNSSGCVHQSRIKNLQFFQQTFVMVSFWLAY